jgi:hypothetical protein
MTKVCGEFDCVRPELERVVEETQRERDVLAVRARELLTAVKFAGETMWGRPGNRFPGYEARVPSEFVTNLEAALAWNATPATRSGGEG